MRPMKRLLAAAVNSLTYVALCTSILALGLVAGFLLASPLSSQVTNCSYKHLLQCQCS